MDEAELELWYAGEKEKALTAYMEHTGDAAAEKAYKEKMRAIRLEYSQKFEDVLAGRKKKAGLKEMIWGLLWKKH